MLVGVKCLTCDKEMIMSDVIRGEQPLVKSFWSCPRHGGIEVTHIKDDKWEEWYFKNKKDTKK